MIVPLLMFMPKMEAAKRKGMGSYGLVSSKYAAAFDRKWVQADFESDSILGTSDIQSLADMANSYEVVKKMRVVPFAPKDVTRLTGAVVAPILPLALLVMPLKDSIKILPKFIL